MCNGLFSRAQIFAPEPPEENVSVINIELAFSVIFLGENFWVVIFAFQYAPHVKHRCVTYPALNYEPISIQPSVSPTATYHVGLYFCANPLYAAGHDRGPLR